MKFSCFLVEWYIKFSYILLFLWFFSDNVKIDDYSEEVKSSLSELEKKKSPFDIIDKNINGNIYGYYGKNNPQRKGNRK